MIYWIIGIVYFIIALIVLIVNGIIAKQATNDFLGNSLYGMALKHMPLINYCKDYIWQSIFWPITLIIYIIDRIFNKE